MMSCFSRLVDACWQWSEVLRYDCDNVTFSCHASQCSPLSIISGPLTRDRKHSNLRLTDGRWADQGQGHTCCCSGAGSQFTIRDKTQIMQRKVLGSKDLYLACNISDGRKNSKCAMWLNYKLFVFSFLYSSKDIISKKSF